MGCVFRSLNGHATSETGEKVCVLLDKQDGETEEVLGNLLRGCLIIPTNADVRVSGRSVGRPTDRG